MRHLKPFENRQFKRVSNTQTWSLQRSWYLCVVTFCSPETESRTVVDNGDRSTRKSHCVFETLSYAKERSCRIAFLFRCFLIFIFLKNKMNWWFLCARASLYDRNFLEFFLETLFEILYAQHTVLELGLRAVRGLSYSASFLAELALSHEYLRVKRSKERCALAL